jgi:hypothetical protein
VRRLAFLLLPLLLPFLEACASSGPVSPGSEGPRPVPTEIRPGEAGSETPLVRFEAVWVPEYGQGIRATVGTFPPFVGEVQGILGDVLLLRTEERIYPLTIPSIRLMEVRRHRRTRAMEGGVLGAVAGAILGRLTLIGIDGEHWESQGRSLAPGLGAIMGGLLGALVGRQFGGDYWQEVRIPASVSLGMRRIVAPER